MYPRELKQTTTILCGFLLIIAGLHSCTPDPPPVEVPFVRLLEKQSFKSNLLHIDMNYAVLLPKEYEKSTTRFPVVYLLHGWGDDETAWYKYGLISYYVDWNANQTVPMIYVMPKGFKTYWVNKYNGSFPMMDVVVKELVPIIDSVYRTIPDAQHRAVMGYSMGGYGALVLPAKNPDVFKTGVVLSMSYRTDQQYLDEPQGVFDSQWGPVFGGVGASGSARLTDYFKEYSPFRFFHNADDPSLSGQNYFLDCGDDEESLSQPNDSLHDVMRELGIRHEYRVRNGGHSWDYWHRALPEALKYIGMAVQNIPYPDDPVAIDPGPAIPVSRIVNRTDPGSGIGYSVVLPSSYSSDSLRYPVIIALHDRNAGYADSESGKLYSLLNSDMAAGSLPAALIVEIPLQQNALTAGAFRQILDQVDSSFRTKHNRKYTILLGNGGSGRIAYNLTPGCPDLINACLLSDADIPPDATADSTGVSYYLDIPDQGINFKGYHSLYMSLRKNNIDHEYRVRRGVASHDSFLDGLHQSSEFIKSHLL